VNIAAHAISFRFAVDGVQKTRFPLAANQNGQYEMQREHPASLRDFITSLTQIRFSVYQRELGSAAA
jgi:hypothetical protein